MKNVLIVLGFLAEAGIFCYLMDRAATAFNAQPSARSHATFHPKGKIRVLNAKIPFNLRKFRYLSIYQVLLDVLKSLLILLISTGISLLFDRLTFSEANIIMVYILGTVIISTITNHPVYGIISSIISVILFNYLFTDPRYTLFVYERGYQSTFAIMFTVAIMIGSLSQRLKAAGKKQAEAELKIKSEQMRANLLRAISHDLRTPLTAISGHASNLLTDEEKFDKSTRSMLYQDIADDCSYLIDLVENLLSVSRITDGEMQLHTETESLEDLLEEAMKHINRKASEHTIKIRMPEEMILINVDSRLIMQVIINLVNNAIAYTQPESFITIEAKQVSKEAVITVADNGPGIQEWEKEKIFDMFYSGNNERGDGVRNSGIGLAVCRSIIQAHGGRIWVEDNKPSGAVFVFTLPAVEVDFYE